MAVTGVIGLDVGSSTVRAAEMSMPKQGSLTLERFGQRALPIGAVRAGISMEPAALTRAVRELWKEDGFTGKKVNLSVNSGQVAVRSISLPALHPTEMRKALPFLVRDVVPIPIDRAVLDFIPLGELDASGKQPGLLVALPSEGVAGIVRAIEKAGLNVTAVDLGPFAALRALVRGREAAGVSAVIDFGATLTTVIVQSEGIPLMVRAIARGGDEITDVLSERLGISRAEAETQKRGFGYDESFGPDVADVVRAALNPLLAEIRSSLAYFASSNQQSPVQQIRLTGGGSLLAGLREALIRQQNISVEQANPFDNITLGSNVSDPSSISATSASAIGLTLGGSLDQSASNRPRPTDAVAAAERLRGGSGKSAAGFDPAAQGGPAH
ncbi:MAG: Chaperone protein dnaK [Glaciihabitans sp.]|nr:Chaperone protein dnaK [Glaciihabitans sp.]